MTEIDWSKAPEGATHYKPVTNDWLKQTERTFIWRASRWELIGNDLGEFSWATKLIERQADQQPTWNGTGLPPVGILMEACWTSTEGTYSTAWSVGHNKDGELVYQLIKTPTGESEGEYFSIGSNTMLGGPSGEKIPKFRPIRTPEQIAAEEREKAIEAMNDLVGDVDNVPTWRDALATIYDAGYRKV